MSMERRGCVSARRVVPTRRLGGAPALCVALKRKRLKGTADTSRTSREAHVRICGGLEVKFLRSTRRLACSAGHCHTAELEPRQLSTPGEGRNRGQTTFFGIMRHCGAKGMIGRGKGVRNRFTLSCILRERSLCIQRPKTQQERHKNLRSAPRINAAALHSLLQA